MKGSKLRWPVWIGVVAEDMEAQSRFYRDVLGLKEVQRGEDWVGFDLEGNLLEILARSDVPQYDRPRVQIGFEVEDIAAVRQELIERGVEPISDIEGGPDSDGYWAYFRDPEGNVFEIKQTIGPATST